MHYCLPAACVAMLASCGYHVAGHADLLPKTVTTVAVPAFTNATTRYKITDWLPEAIAKEFISRSRSAWSTADPADMVLKGSVLTYTANAILFNRKTGLWPPASKSTWSCK